MKLWTVSRNRTISRCAQYQHKRPPLEVSIFRCSCLDTIRMSENTCILRGGCLKPRHGIWKYIFGKNRISPSHTLIFKRFVYVVEWIHFEKLRVQPSMWASVSQSQYFFLSLLETHELYFIQSITQPLLLVLMVGSNTRICCPHVYSRQTWSCV